MTVSPSNDRKPPDFLPRDVFSTTRFFRNRPQHQAVLAASSGDKALIVGCSRGCEAYSLAIEAELIGERLDIDAIDFDAQNIQEAIANEFSPSDFIDFDGQDLIDVELSRFVDKSPPRYRIALDRIGSRLNFSPSDLFDVRGSYDLIVCNNVLIHFQDDRAATAIRHMVEVLRPGGIIALGGINLDVMSSAARSQGLVPVLSNVRKIWDSWKGDRLSWETEPHRYVAMPPLDATLSDWEYRFATIFRKAA